MSVDDDLCKQYSFLYMQQKEVDNIYEKIGKRIVEFRRVKGYSQERLASESGIDRSHMGFIEQGRRKPTISTLYKISKTLGIRFEELFKGLN